MPPNNDRCGSARSRLSSSQEGTRFAHFSHYKLSAYTPCCWGQSVRDIVRLSHAPAPIVLVFCSNRNFKRPKAAAMHDMEQPLLVVCTSPRMIKFLNTCTANRSSALFEASVNRPSHHHVSLERAFSEQSASRSAKGNNVQRTVRLGFVSQSSQSFQACTLAPDENVTAIGQSPRDTPNIVDARPPCIDTGLDYYTDTILRSY